MNVNNKKVRVTKLVDNVYNGNHENGINPGFESTGTAHGDLEVGKPFFVLREGGVFHTSTVSKINDDMTFNTRNSVYKIEILD